MSGGPTHEDLSIVHDEIVAVATRLGALEKSVEEANKSAARMLEMISLTLYGDAKMKIIGLVSLAEDTRKIQEADRLAAAQKMGEKRIIAAIATIIGSFGTLAIQWALSHYGKP